jgi:hydrogenase expression/formation protein HypC
MLMCLALPAQITQLLDDKRAMVNLGGVRKEISISLLDTVSEGDYVIIHVGYALTRLDEEEAKKTLRLFADMLEGGDSQ